MSGQTLSGKKSLPPPRFAAIDPMTGQDVRELPISEQYQHHRKQTRIHERSAQTLVERVMNDQRREEYLRAKFPALQTAWDAYRFTLKMVDDLDQKEEHDMGIDPCSEDESSDEDEAYDPMGVRMNDFMVKHRAAQAAAETGDKN